jgi:hypothetical protein
MNAEGLLLIESIPQSSEEPSGAEAAKLVQRLAIQGWL